MSDVGQDWQIRLFENDCLDVLRWLPSECVDLIVTSPPYADQRKHTYGGVHPDKYVEWFLPIAAELKRVLKQKGSFILNIKERVVDGERHTYVLELILALRKKAGSGRKNISGINEIAILVNGLIASVMPGNAACTLQRISILPCTRTRCAFQWEIGANRACAT